VNATVTHINALASTEIIEAMRSVAVGSDHWKLGEALAVQIPAGNGGFEEIVEEAKAAGVDAGLSPTTLRLYRDAAIRWPADKRIPNVSFSAHREVLPLEDVEARRKLLIDLVNQHGAAGVSVGKVKAAVKAVRAAQAGAAVPVPSAKLTTEEVTAAALLADILAGSPLLIKAIGTGKGHDLDKLHAGLNKALAKVDTLRAKANQRATAAAKRASTTPKANTTPAPKATPKASTTPKAKAETTPKANVTPIKGDMRSL
jgi:hypothetical protein